jgi:hypothetical protein
MRAARATLSRFVASAPPGRSEPILACRDNNTGGSLSRETTSGADTPTRGVRRGVPYPSPNSALISQRSIEARVPGVSAGSIASRGPSAAAMSSAVSKS